MLRESSTRADHNQQRIYSWSKAEGLTIERDNPLDPVNLAFDKQGDLMVVSAGDPPGTVRTRSGPDHSKTEFRLFSLHGTTGRVSRAAGELLETVNL